MPGNSLKNSNDDGHYIPKIMQLQKIKTPSNKLVDETWNSDDNESENDDKDETDLQEILYVNTNS